MGGLDANELRRRGERLDPNAVEPMQTPARPAAELDAESALHAAPTLAERYTAAKLREDCARPAFSFATLPAWPHASDGAGHGWGRALNRALGGLVPGRFIVVGAAGAKAGKTSFLMQLADGLALHSAGVLAGERSGPLLPALILSEMGAEALTYRTLGRWFGCSSRWFAAAPDGEIDGADEMLDEARARRLDEIARTQRSAAEALDEGGALAAMRRFQRAPDNPGSGTEALDRAELILNAWSAQLHAETGRDVWPVLVVDPIQRFASGKAGEVEGLNELAERLGRFARAGRIVLATSDTNKAAAKGGEQGADKRDAAQDAAAILRGSYALPHAVDAVLILGPDPGAAAEPTKANEARPVVVSVGLNRWGPGGVEAGFAWEPWSGRFMATERAAVRRATKDETKARRATEKEREAQLKANRDKARREKERDRALDAADDEEHKATAAESKAKYETDPAKKPKREAEARLARAKATAARQKAERLAKEADA